ncbi:hypothetical protein [Desulfitobacterium chlororespirans]|uniref:Uncharacterized protein n=1 Tax=Desulfitobacterium chlororespirans DSM 11544 TaxID=1121395 RepID=A0A1M7V004_9FIRM|nr:hypothetical protein [Desulfitobacterium chlororespirans]SHN88505.1 hypothetical protein SAMN02745215_05372 [Desulfitobacterium chlororespirans DSM 11544]
MKAKLMEKHAELIRSRKYAVAWRLFLLLNNEEITLFKNINGDFSAKPDREADLILKSIGCKCSDKKYLTQYQI